MLHFAGMVRREEQSRGRVHCSAACSAQALAPADKGELKPGTQRSVVVKHAVEDQCKHWRGNVEHARSGCCHRTW